MIDKLMVKNFKSIKERDIDCKRINLFIGEPNTGKSNILEALGLFSWRGHRAAIKDFLRFDELQDLFYDGLLDEKIEVFVDRNGKLSIEIIFTEEKYIVKSKINGIEKGECTLASPEDIKILQRPINDFSFLKYYKFLSQKGFSDSFVSYLHPPHGSNLFALARGNKKISDMMAEFYKEFNLKVMFKTRDKSIEIVKQRDDLLIGYPYISTSDTLQRIIFFSAAMESNNDSALIFEEPESFAFPYYTKYLGERIAFDESNQYFISTHNPYLLLAVLEKAPKDSVNVFVTYLKGYQTGVKVLTEEEIPILMDSDPFFNLDLFIEEEKK